MEGSTGSGLETKIGADDGKSEAADVTSGDPYEDWEAFCKFLINRQPPRYLSECTAYDVVQFLQHLSPDRIETVVHTLSAATFKEIIGSHKENPFDSQIVRTFLNEKINYRNNSGRYKSESTGRKHVAVYKNLFTKCLTTSDVGNSLIVAIRDTTKYFPRGTNNHLRFEDESKDGKLWLFTYQLLGESYVLTKGWSSYVKEKQLGVGDYVFFQQHLTDSTRLFIGCRRHKVVSAPTEYSSSTVPNPTLPATSFETPLQLQFPEHRIPVVDSVVVISCDDNQELEETYFISYILNELCLRGFTPLRYVLTKCTVNRNLEMLHKSRVGIMIFSMNYVCSRQCLDEFVAIMDHLKASNLVLLPVFFKVKLSDVKSQLSSFENAFSPLGKSVQPSQVLKWRAIMDELTSINRYQYMKGDEVVLAKNIVRDVCLLVSSETCRNLIGIRFLLESILPLLHCPEPSASQIVGIWGMAGIGKTTFTAEIFRTQAGSYDLSYFLPDFHIMCQKEGLSHLRHDFFSKIFGEEKAFIDARDTKQSFTRDRFLDKRVLIVIDGVSNARDAEVLVGGFGWFSGGHTVILTSRNRQVLVQCKAKELYEIPKLSEAESFSLCCQYVTEQNWKGNISLISELVNYASGIPFALPVLGSSVQEQCHNQKEHLRRLCQHPQIEIQDAFTSSFNGLDDNEKNTFLDLACFFRGQNKDHVVNILDGCGFFTDVGIYGLIDESLISLVDNMIEMPNIFQDMGKFVVCQEHEEAGKRSRLWGSNDIAYVLKNNTGTEAIEGIFLDVSGLTFELSPTVFERMYRLRLLKLHSPTSENHYKVCLPQGLYSLPDELRLLHWERYPLGSFPRNFNPKNLVELNMPYSNMTKLWKGTKNLEKLKRIILSHSRKLTKFPRISKARNLEHIDLEGCTSLVKVNSSVLQLYKLTFLSLKDCSHLRIMPTTVHLESLEVLNLSGCSELEDLQDFSPNLKELYLSATAIREMPSSMEDLTRLVTLDLENCKKLQHLSPWISNLKAMVTLNLSGCSNLKSLPIRDALFPPDSQCLDRRIIMEESVSLKLHSAIQKSRDAREEFLRAFEYPSSNVITQESWPRVTVTFIPSSVSHSLASKLYSLVSLFLCNSYLEDIPKELCWLALVKTLDLGGNTFSQIPKSIKELRKLHSLRLRHCKNLRSLPELPRSLEILNAHGCVSLESFPSGFEQVPKHYTFSNCFNLSPEMVIKCIKKAQYSIKGMAEGHQLEHSNVPAFSICMPASAGYKSLVNFQAGSSVERELTPGMLKAGFTLSVVVEFWDNYRNTDGFGIKCICRKTRTDFSPRLERIFYCWAPKEAPIVRKDHMFVFGCAKMHSAERSDHDFLADMVSFEFHPVDCQNKLLVDSCAVKKCGIYLFTAARCDTAVSAKRPSSMDPRELSSVEHMAPQHKRCRLKKVIESEREKGISSIRSIAERNRRKRIRECVKKLSELVPNMDKQTSSREDMLDVTVDYIKDLEIQYKILKQNRANCKCMNKEKMAL